MEAVWLNVHHSCTVISTMIEVPMRTITYSEARQNLSETMMKAVEDREPVLITRQNGGDCVLMSLQEFSALEETFHLLRSPENARRLLHAIEELGSGDGLERDLIE